MRTSAPHNSTTPDAYALTTSQLQSHNHSINHLLAVGSAPPVSDLTPPDPHPALMASVPFQAPVPAKPLNPRLGLLNERRLTLAGPMTPRLLLLCVWPRVISSVLAGGCELAALLLLREERDRRRCPVESFAPRACSLRSIAIGFSHEELAKGVATSLALRCLLHWTDSAMHGSDVYVTGVFLWWLHSTR